MRVTVCLFYLYRSAKTLNHLSNIAQVLLVLLGRQRSVVPSWMARITVNIQGFQAEKYSVPPVCIFDQIRKQNYTSSHKKGYPD